MFKSTVNRGFQMEFDNGVEISVQWGYGNYCAAKDAKKQYAEELREEIHESKTAEVSIFKGDRNITLEFAKLHNLNSDGYGAIGWLNPEQILDAMNWAKNYKEDSIVGDITSCDDCGGYVSIVSLKCVECGKNFDDECEEE